MCPEGLIREHKKIQCALVHDHVLLRQGLRRLLEDEPDIVIVAEAGSATEALQKIGDLHPEVVIAGAHLFQGLADEAERLILKQSPNSKVLFLTAPDDARERETIHAVRRTPAEELVAKIREITSTTVAPAGDESPRPLEEVRRNRALTAREREVLKLLAEGRTVRSVAEVLGLSMKTVDAHKFNLMRKLGIHNKAELVMWAIQQQIVKVPVNF